MRTRLIFVLIVALASVTPGATARAFSAQQQGAKPGQGTGTQKPPAQTTKPKPKPTPKLPIGARLFGVVESETMAASSTFKAQAGSSSVVGFGVGGEVLNLWRKLFLRVGVSSASVEGTRGFVIDSVFVSNGVPLKLGVRNFDLGAGWRSYLTKHPRVALYIAGGLSGATNRQESPDADAGDNDSKSGNGAFALLGFEFALQKKAKNPLVAGVEAGFRSVGGVLGEAAGSKGFSEDNLGGYSVRALIGIRFKK